MSTTQEKPAVCNWFVAFCILQVILSIIVVAVGAFYPKIAEFAQEEMDTAHIAGPMYMFFGLLYMTAYALALFLLPKPWVWTYSLILICLGLTGCLTIPAAIPLLIFWIKPETKAYFKKI